MWEYADAPEIPETPEIPEIPDTIGEPESPEIPDMIEEPETPESPETPDVPDAGKTLWRKEMVVRFFGFICRKMQLQKGRFRIYFAKKDRPSLPKCFSFLLVSIRIIKL